MKKKIILGIDPGYGRTGYGVIDAQGQKLTCLDYGVIETSAREKFKDRLNHLHQDLKKIIKKYNPEIVAIEDLFFFKNAKTAMKVGQARGVIILTAVQAKKEVVEFTPLQVKQAIAGYGRAEKAQMQKMVKVLLGLKELPKPDDAADALAIAICAASTLRLREFV
ncbi:crossover junction endodeoxyribonuclease RuvC [Candidatus Falkowbacteria bacterium]|nr:crossover junction endodeoxyribonuclease RuvC [Candidatus Falkowbacteria bacterium]